MNVGQLLLNEYYLVDQMNSQILGTYAGQDSENPFNPIQESVDSPAPKSESAEIENAVEKALARAARLRQAILKRAFEGRLSTD